MGWTPPAPGSSSWCRLDRSPQPRGALISNLPIAVDLAKDVFEVAVEKPSGNVIERKRLTRAQFERFREMRETCRVVIEACASAHHWARRERPDI
jgi:hypothetical protein